MCPHPLQYPLTCCRSHPANTPPKPTVGSLVTGRSVCTSGDCKGVARAVVADQAALDARKKSRQAKSDAANATAEARRSVNNKDSKRSKKLVDVEARALGDAVDSLVGDVTGTVGDVTGSVGLKTRDGKEVRAAVTDDAAIDARQQSKEAKSAASNATAEARSLHKNEKKGRSKNLERAAVTDDAAIDARQQSKEAKSAASNATAEARSVKDRKGRSVNLERAAVTDDAAIDARQQSKEAKSAASNATAEARSVAPKNLKSRKSRRSHQLW